MLGIINLRLTEAIEDISKGGLAATLAEVCIKSGIGMVIDLKKVPNRCERVDEILFSETHGRFLIGADRGNEDKIKSVCASYNIPCETIGEAKGDKLVFEIGAKRVEVRVEELEHAWRSTIPRLMGDEP
jgi:phosphoribosylformylglycinamidine synthase